MVSSDPWAATNMAQAGWCVSSDRHGLVRISPRAGEMIPRVPALAARRKDEQEDCGQGLAVFAAVLRLGGERGMVREEKLFLTRNTLPLFDQLLDLLDALPGELSRRSASPFFYAGLATRYEDERLTEEERDNLPERINELRSGRFGTWLSDREWIPAMLETAAQPRRLLLKLDVDANNIDRLESMSCEEVFAQRERDYQDSYSAIPALDELCERYGDRENRRIYMMSRDVEGRWLDQHQRATGASKPID
jgi:hypothetical protein